MNYTVREKTVYDATIVSQKTDEGMQQSTRVVVHDVNSVDPSELAKLAGLSNVIAVLHAKVLSGEIDPKTLDFETKKLLE